MASPKKRRAAKLAILKAREEAVRAKEIADNIAAVARKIAAEKAVKPLKEVLKSAEAKAATQAEENEKEEKIVNKSVQEEAAQG